MEQVSRYKLNFKSNSLFVCVFFLEIRSSIDHNMGTRSSCCCNLKCFVLIERCSYPFSCPCASKSILYCICYYTVKSLIQETQEFILPQKTVLVCVQNDVRFSSLVYGMYAVLFRSIFHVTGNTSFIKYILIQLIIY